MILPDDRENVKLLVAKCSFSSVSEYMKSTFQISSLIDSKFPQLPGPAFASFLMVKVKTEIYQHKFC